MGKCVEYHKLRTLADVQKERRRVRRAIQRRKEWLEDDFDKISEVLSVDYWVSFLSDKISSITSGWMSMGFNLVSSLLGKVAQPSSKPGRRRRRRYDEDEEDLILIVERDENYDDYEE